MGTFLAVQWLGLCSSTAGSSVLIPDQGTKIPHAVQRGKKKKKREKSRMVTLINLPPLPVTLQAPKSCIKS